MTTQPANIGPQDVPRNPPLTSPGRPLKVLFDHPRGRPNVTSRGRPDLTSWEHPEMTSRGRPNVTFKGRPREVDSGCPQDVVRTFPRGPLKHPHLDVPKFLLTFLLELIRSTKSI